MIFDAHVHFWKYDPQRDTWIDHEMGKLKRNFLPADYKKLLNNYQIDGCIAVQADQSEEETIFLLNLAESNPFIKGVVGWLDLCGKNLEPRLKHFSENPLFKGVRYVLQDKNPNFILGNQFLNGIAQLAKFNLTYDILVYPEQLKAVNQLVAKFPEQPFVIDHLAKPHIKEANINSWQQEIKKVAQFHNVHCKISGLITEADWKNWKKEDFTEYLDVVFTAFGIDRVFFASDWPVCKLAGTYAEVVEIIRNYMKDFTDSEREAVFLKNAQKFYNT